MGNGGRTARRSRAPRRNNGGRQSTRGARVPVVSQAVAGGSERPRGARMHRSHAQHVAISSAFFI